MKIAQIAPLIESVPPRLYGGTGRVVSYLTEALVTLGHEVTLFSSADSVTSASLVGCAPIALRLDEKVRDVIPYYMLMLDRVRRRAQEFDVLHFHFDHLHFPLFRDLAPRVVTTLHGRQDLPDNVPMYVEFDDMKLISISDAQRAPVPKANFVRTIHHGLPINLIRPNFNPEGGYLAFLGRISPEKRPDRAIRIAQSLGYPLRIAAKVDKVDQRYFDETIKPLLNLSGIDFIGEINEQQKPAFLSNALALLFPIDWPEPFGLVMIEAMAAGTPVLAFDNGSVGEVLTHGKTGLVVGSMEEAIAQAPKLFDLNRRSIRAEFESRFTAERMASDHVALYEEMVIGARASSVPLTRQSANGRCSVAAPQSVAAREDRALRSQRTRHFLDAT